MLVDMCMLNIAVCMINLSKIYYITFLIKGPIYNMLRLCNQ